MQQENRAGWYALLLSITQNISPSKALSVMDGKHGNLHKLTWPQFLAAYREEEEKLREEQQKRNGSEKVRQYQHEYRRLHPLTEEQKRRRREYMRKYRESKKPAVPPIPGL